jgi:methionyl-tRNA formyltransferase
MRLGFVTCVQLGLSCMETIYRAGGELSFAMTLLDSQAPNKSGRVYIDDFCQAHGISLHKSSHINNADAIDAIKNAQLDWLFIIGWSQIASRPVLEATRFGVMGIHPTLLPEGRGRAAVPWAILKGLDKTGVTMFKMDEGVDTGPIAAQIEIPLTNATTATALYERVETAHVALMSDVIQKLRANALHLVEQDESKATIWPGRKPEDGAIDLEGSVWQAERLVRAVTRPYPGAYYDVDGIRHFVWEAHVGAKDEPADGPVLRFNDGILHIAEQTQQLLA